jgi:Predicted membrane protein
MAQRTVLYGPIQLFVVGFPGNQFKGEIIPAINEARDNGIIRMIDYVFVMKDEGGNITAVQGTDLGKREIKFFDSVLGALIGYGAAGVEGAEYGAEAGAEYAEMNLGLTEDDIRKAAKQIPNNSSSLLMIVENLWAKKIKQALVNAGGVMVAQGTLTPELMVKIGASIQD